MAVDTGGLVQGVFSLFAMVHTMAWTAADGEHQSVPWDGSSHGGPFTYASKPCTGQAPVNNIATDLPALGGAVPGSRVPASTRSHPLRFEVVPGGDGPALRGTIALTVCQLQRGPTDEPDPVPDHTKPRIEVAWQAEVDRTGSEFASWRGTFALVGGTGRYADLRGEGDIAGYFFCFDSEAGAERGALLDGQYAMIGRYRVPAAAAQAP
jgi:hypothetical protein